MGKTRADAQREANALSAYVPNTLLEILSVQNKAHPHRKSTVTGALVCLDASGFTAMTRALSEQGRSGPELLTRHLNAFFEEMCGVVFDHGGDILKFAGDAYWALFQNDFNICRYFADSLEALSHVNSSSDIAHKYPLSVHIGADYGDIKLFSLGNPKHRLELEPAGEIVSRVFTACDLAGDNQMLIGDTLKQQYTIAGTTHADNSYFLNIEPVDSPAIQTKTPLSRIPALSHDKFSVYLPAIIADRALSGSTVHPLQNEYRQVTAMFINFQLEDEAISGSENASAGLSSIFDIIKDCDGTIARIDPYTSGHKLLALFGAPIKTDQDELNAIACAHKIIQSANPRLQIKIGLSYGPLFCGDVGSTFRREYTVMGESVNLAARLMSKASPSEAIFCLGLRSRLPVQVSSETCHFSLKGVGDAVACYKLTGISATHNSANDSIQLIGLDSELQILNESWNQVRSGRCQVLTMFGPSGVGKSALASRFLSELDNASRENIPCRLSAFHGPGWLLSRILESTAGIDDTNDDAQNKLKFLIENAVPQEWLPLFAPIYGDTLDDTPWTSGLSPQLRDEKRAEWFANLLERYISDPKAVIIDDFDKADELSQSTLKLAHARLKKIPLMLLYISRASDTSDTDSSELSNLHHLEIKQPTPDEWRHYFERQFEQGKREQEVWAKILEASHGNPYCVMSAVNQMLESGNIQTNAHSGKFEIINSVTTTVIPDDVASLHLSKFDRLPESDRNILKIASTIQMEFSIDTLNRLLDKTNGSTEDILNKLLQKRVLTKSANSSFVFSEPAFGEAIYSCIPELERRSLHLRFAQTLKGQTSQSNSAALAHHYFNGADYLSAFEYSLAAALDADAKRSLSDATRFYQQGDESRKHIPPAQLETDKLLKFHNGYARSLALSGRFRNSYKQLRAMRQVAKRSSDTRNGFHAALETAKLLWKQSRYKRAETILNWLIERSNAMGDSTTTSRALSVLAEVRRREGDFKSARELCQRAITIAKRESDTETLADSYNKLGLAHWGDGDLHKALECYHESQKLGSVFGKYGEAQFNNNVGLIYQSLGKYTDSSNAYQSAVDTFKELGDRRNEAYASGNLANVRRVLGWFTSSIDLFKRADTIFQRLNDKHAHYYTVGNLGDVDLILGELSSAKRRFDDSAEFAESVGDKELAVECQTRLGDHAFFSADIPAAEILYNKSLHDSQAIGSQEYYLRSSLGLARLYIGERNYSQALELIAVVKEVSEKAGAVITLHEAEFLLGEYSRITRDYDSADSYYYKALTYARAEGAFELVLKSCARIVELRSKSSSEALSNLKDLKRAFIIRESEPLWNQVTGSAYFSFFADGLNSASE